MGPPVAIILHTEPGKYSDAPERITEVSRKEKGPRQAFLVALLAAVLGALAVHYLRSLPPRGLRRDPNKAKAGRDAFEYREEGRLKTRQVEAP